MQEKLLQFIWQNLLFDTRDLFTTDGEPVYISERGILNPDSGPDFINARVRIGGTTWAGNIEIHLQPGDWFLHGHQSDPAYDSTILHVCREPGCQVYRTDGTRIPCLILGERLKPAVFETYRKLMQNEKNIPCSSLIRRIDHSVWSEWLDQLCLDRLERKTQPIIRQLEETRYDWDEVFYRILGRQFGMKINADPFERLTLQLPYRMLLKYREDPEHLEALLFGAAGFLEEEGTDGYFTHLQSVFRWLQKKHAIQQMHASEWKFLRMMPAGFPTVRLAQFAGLLHQKNNLFSQLMGTMELTDIMNYLTISTPEYWQKHYPGGIAFKTLNRSTGKHFLYHLLINAIIPFKFIYGHYKHIPELQENARELLNQMPPENNRIIRNWEDLGIRAKNSAESQALLQLKNELCDKRQCIRCSIGIKIIQDENHGLT